MSEDLSPAARDLIERARSAALTVAERQGLAVEHAEPLSLGSNIVFQLWPYDIVARVSGVASQILPGGEEEAARRELDVVRYLANAGAPVLPLCRSVDPGPHSRDGLVVTLWDRIFEEDVVDYAPRAMEALRQCHMALKSYRAPLAYLHGYAAARRVFLHLWRTEALDPEHASDVVRRLAVLDRAMDEIRYAADVQNIVLHGDAHLGNVLCVRETASNPVLWIDWDEVCVGPVEWDYACMIVEFREEPARPDREAVLRALVAGEFDPARLDIMIEARTLQIEMWDTALATV